MAIENGANLDIKNVYGYTALIMAMDNVSSKYAETLIKGGQM